MKKIKLPDLNGKMTEVVLKQPILSNNFHDTKVDLYPLFTAGRSLGEYTLASVSSSFKARKHSVRIAYSAAHVVSDPLRDKDPWLKPSVDWDATINYRRYLWSLGLGVAEAMDTAQRGMGLDWNVAKELIRQTLIASKDFPDAKVVCGCGTDHLALKSNLKIDDVIRAYEEQMETIENYGGKLVIMASRALALCAKSSKDYELVYNRILSQAKEPVMIHWLGEMFDPQLKGYWGSNDHYKAMDTCLKILAENSNQIDGIKISLLDKEKEIFMRRKLPDDIKMYTGDDFNYPELIAGDDIGYSHALLGIFDPIAPLASIALDALADGNIKKYNEILEPTLPLSRHIFEAPTQFYKTGVVFLAYLNGHQNHFTMVGGQQSSRSVLHLIELFKLANNCGLLINPNAAKRMKTVMKIYGL
jgi:hypothetical protein